MGIFVPEAQKGDDEGTIFTKVLILLASNIPLSTSHSNLLSSLSWQI
jgi:hypothetical protein